MTGFEQQLDHDCTAAERITGMRIDIGEMRSDMRHLVETVAGYMERSEQCQQDHEARLRAVETAAIAVAQIADIDRRLDILEKSTAEATGRDRTIGYLITAGVGFLSAGIGLFAGRI